jgi:hypothetical protein
MAAKRSRKFGYRPYIAASIYLDAGEAMCDGSPARQSTIAACQKYQYRHGA